MAAATMLIGTLTLGVLSTISGATSLVAPYEGQGEVRVAANRAATFAAERIRQSGVQPEAELEVLGRTSLGYHAIQFRVNESMDSKTAEITWSEPREIGFAYEVGEAQGGTQVVNGAEVLGLAFAAPDGRDNDGDGLVDEGIIYYKTTSAAGADVTKVVAADVLPATHFRLQSGATVPAEAGDVVLLHIEVARRSKTSATERVKATVDLRVTPRNRPPVSF
jgi:hypothetical protein